MFSTKLKTFSPLSLSLSQLAEPILHRHRHLPLSIWPRRDGTLTVGNRSDRQLQRIWLLNLDFDDLFLLPSPQISLCLSGELCAWFRRAMTANPSPSPTDFGEPRPTDPMRRILLFFFLGLVLWVWWWLVVELLWSMLLWVWCWWCMLLWVWCWWCGSDVDEGCGKPLPKYSWIFYFFGSQNTRKQMRTNSQNNRKHVLKTQNWKHALSILGLFPLSLSCLLHN